MTQSTESLLDERRRTHGDFIEHATITQMIKATMHGSEGWLDLSNAQMESLDMIAHKIGRILAGNPNHRDHWDDIAGYAALSARECKEP